ncbi:MAG: EamA family transporter, partial [Candidatus Zixiibacteriota bacterium]
GVVGVAESEPFLPTRWQAIVPLVGLGLMVQVLGWWTITSVISRVKTAQAGLILLLQPTLATVWGALLFAELLTPMQIAGAVVTLAAMYVGSTQKRNEIS